MRIIKTLVVTVSSIFMIVACGPVEATPDMTLSVTPSEISFTDTSQTVSTSTDSLVISVITGEGTPAVGVIVYASTDPFWINNDLVWFPDCPNRNTCSCTTDSFGKCIIRVSYKHGGGLQYDADIVVYSGALSQVVTISVSAQ